MNRSLQEKQKTAAPEFRLHLVRVAQVFTTALAVGYW
jgi:hypothetical protein